MPLISGLELLKSQTKAIAEEDKDLLVGLAIIGEMYDIDGRRMG